MAFEGQLVLDASAFPALSGFRLVSSEQVRGAQGVPVRVAHPDPGLQLTFAPDGPMPGGWYQLELQFPPEGLVDAVYSFGLPAYLALAHQSHPRNLVTQANGSVAQTQNR